MDREIFRSNEYRRNMFQHAKCFIKKKCVFEKKQATKKEGIFSYCRAVSTKIIIYNK